MVYLFKEDFKLEVFIIDFRDQRYFVNFNSQEEIDKLLMDLELFLQKMEIFLGELFVKGKSINFFNSYSYLIVQSYKDFEFKFIVFLVMEKVLFFCLIRIIENNGYKMEEEDRVFLFRIMESIEDFV